MLSEEDIKRALSLMLFRQVELAKNDLMNKAEVLVNDHFNQTLSSNNILKSSQLKNLEGVAFTALCKAPVLDFVRNQSNKEDPDKPDKKKWTHNDLHENLSDAIKTIGSDDVDYVCERLIEKAREVKIDDNSVETWLTEDRKKEMGINMVRSFLSFFATYYEYIMKKRGFNGTEEEAGR